MATSTTTEAPERPLAPPGTIVVHTDVVCGWATVMLSRLYERRRALGLEGEVHVDHRLFLLEDVNRFAIPMLMVQGEVPVLGRLAPEVGFRIWEEHPSSWPVSSLLANEAVHAAKVQGPAAAEQLDWALRLAFFRDSRCITMLHVVLDVAGGCPDVDADRLADDLTTGRARSAMLHEYRASRDRVQGSPHVFLPDGTDVHNPGVELEWQGEPGEGGFPVVTADDPGAVDRLLEAAARGGPTA